MVQHEKPPGQPISPHLAISDSQDAMAQCIEIAAITSFFVDYGDAQFLCVDGSTAISRVVIDNSRYELIHSEITRGTIGHAFAQSVSRGIRVL
ncbi:hypothetical protein AVEN_220534-1 [Araneus ventricosus]|uniref:Uncharacterized protein n=1 Tax=Araneus ventricosus TaxID=182803 RepID=A0A4Y2S6V1_ARAVE|nr:hypothetical protein AVEN_220534-1 [Araneus ventricosus]